jgi:hypothetical protein
MFLPYRVWLFVSLVTLPSIAGAAAPPQSAAAPGPTIVTVDFRVLTSDGVPVPNLKPEDVVLKVGGSVREILALEFVRTDSGQTGQRAAAAPVPPPAFRTNLPPASGRDVVIVIDEEGIAPGREQPVKDAIGDLIAALSPDDRVSLLTVKGGTFMRSTTAHDRVTAAAASLTGRASVSESAADAACRSRQNLDALRAVFDNAVPIVPTVVVFATNGATSPTGVEGIARQSGPAGPCEVTYRDLEDVRLAAVASRADLFVIQTSEDAAGGPREMTAGLEHIAGLTGNAMQRLIGKSGSGMKRIASETSAYYLAAFEAPASERTGASQRVEVSTAKPGVEIRVRPSLVIPKASVKTGKANPPKVRDLLSATKAYRDLPLRGIAYTSRASSDGRLRVVAIVESSDPAARPTAAAAALFDAQGKARAQWTAEAADLKRAPMMATLAAPAPGTYRLRVAVAAASGIGGTIDEDVTVAATEKGTPSVGALVLGVQAGGSFSPRLQFAKEPAAVAMLEVSGLTKAAVVSVAFELAGSESGPALVTLNGSVSAPRDDLRIGYVGVPIGPMPPGDVVIRGVVTVDGQALAVRPVRTLHKVGG